MDRDFLKDETFGGTFPYEPHFIEINGFNMHYVDEGEGECIVCIHGMPTWSYLYRNFIKNLSKDYRVIAPDHMGFGKSDVPLNKQYVMEQHIDNLTTLLLNLGLKKISLIVQDWGGPIGLGFAVNFPDKISNLIIMNTSVGVMKEDKEPWYAPLEKRGKYHEFIKNISNIMKMGISNKKKITSQLIEAYSAPFPKDEYYIGALAFPKDIPVGQNHPSANIMQEVRQKLPVLSHKKKILIWGLRDPIFPEWMIDWWKKIFPEIEVHKIENASHFLQEDSPDEIISIIRDFLK